MSSLQNKNYGLFAAAFLTFGLAACSQDDGMDETIDDSGDSASTPAAETAPVFDRDPVPPSPTAAQDLLARGEYLVEGIVGCGNCHNGRDDNGELVPGLEFAGNFVINEPNGPGPGGLAFTAIAPNITQHEEFGIGAWTDEEIENAIRFGISPDGRVLGPPMAFPYYQGISDEDMDAIIAYLRTIPGNDRQVEAST